MFRVIIIKLQFQNIVNVTEIEAISIFLCNYSVISSVIKFFSSLSTMKAESRPEQHSLLRTELMRSYHQLSQLRSLHKQEREHRQVIIQPLIEAARAYPNQTTEILTRHLFKGSTKQKKS